MEKRKKKRIKENQKESNERGEKRKISGWKKKEKWKIKRNLK